jgi:hypothetical protein
MSDTAVPPPPPDTPEAAAPGTAAWGPPPAAPNAVENPYVGPRSLGEDDGIFGRSAEITEVRRRLLARRIVLIYSQSGAGKSSLLEAGVAPELRSRGFEVLPTIRVGHEFEGTPPTANRYCISMIDSLEERLHENERLRPEMLSQVDLVDYVAGLCDRASEDQICLVFDQFEEVFTLHPTDVDAKRQFFQSLGEVLKDDRLFVLFSMREDFIAQLDPYLEYLPTRLKTRYRLELLDKDAAAEAARAPAKRVGVDFQADAVEELIDDLRRVPVQTAGGVEMAPGPFVEPLQLQVVCRRLWSPDSEVITTEDVRAGGGVDRALRDYYDRAVEHTVHETDVDEKTLRNWFATQLITNDGIPEAGDERPRKGRRGCARRVTRGVPRAARPAARQVLARAEPRPFRSPDP